MNKGSEERRKRFIAEYLVDLNATQAAIRAGYSKKSAEAQGSRLLRNAVVQQHVKAAQERQLLRLDLKSDKVMRELERIAFSDLRKLFTAGGDLKGIQDLSEEESAVVASLEVVKKNIAAGDGKVDTIHKLRVWDKLKALEMLAKHFGLLTEQVQHKGEIVLRWDDA